MSKTLLDLPPNLTSTAQLATVLQDRIRELNQILATLVATPSDGDVDFGANRITNLGDPQTDLDGVNYRTLKRFQSDSPALPAPPSSAGAVSFRAVARGYAELSIEDLIVKGAASVDAVEFVAWAIDEADINLRFALGVALPNASGSFNVQNSLGLVGGISTNPATSGSRLGRAVGVGDFLYVAGEIVKVTALTLSTMTLARAGQLGSTITTHGAGALWYKISPYTFTVPARPQTANMPARVVPEAATAAVATGGVPTRWDFAAPNLCVVAIAAAARTGSASGPVTVVNYTKIGANNPRVDGVHSFDGSPGLRTLSGAAYTDIGIIGTLSSGQFADVVTRVQAWHSIRNVYGFLSAPATDTVTAYVLYYAPDRLSGAIVQKLTFREGDYISQPASSADGVELPSGNWPPNILASTPMDGLRAQYPPGAGDPMIMAAGGWFDVVVDEVDGTSADLSVVIAV